MRGTLNGVMIATTPRGSRIDIENFPGTSDGMVSPLTFRHMPAAARTMASPLLNSNMALPTVEPTSSIRQSTSSDWRLSMISATRNSQRSRSVGVVSLYVGNADFAAAIALRMSSPDPFAATA